MCPPSWWARPARARPRRWWRVSSGCWTGGSSRRKCWCSRRRGRARPICATCLALAAGTATPGSLARSVASFAFHVVRSSEVHAGAEPPQLLTGADEDQIVQDLLEGDELDAAAGESRWPEWVGSGIRSSKAFRSEVRAFMAECAALGVEPPALAALGADQDRAIWVSMASFMAEYHRVRTAIRGAHRDPAGLIREAAGILRTAEPGAASLGQSVAAASRARRRCAGA